MLKCEFFNCNNMNGKDYKRMDDEIEKGWEDEPIFLCIEHGRNHEAIENQNIQVGLDENNVTCIQEFKSIQK